MGEQEDQKEKEKKWLMELSLTENQLAELKECFALFDQGDGHIDATDVGSALRALGQIPTEAEVRQIEEICNTEEAGGVATLEDFVRIAATRGIKGEFDMEEELEEAMRFFDKDASGFLKAEDLRSALRELGEPIDDEDIAELLKMAEVDANGRIAYVDFVRKIVAK